MSQQNSKLRRHYLYVHFGVAMDLLLMVCGLLMLSILLFVLPVTCRTLPSFSFTGIVLSLWNVTSLVAVAAMLRIVIFLPSNLNNRRWTQIWLIVLLSCQAIFILLPDRQSFLAVATVFPPAWIGVGVLVGLLQIESLIGGSEWGTAVNQQQPIAPIKQRLKKGGKKLFYTTTFALGLAFLVATGITLVAETRRQISARHWPVAQAKLIRCETVEGPLASLGRSFHLEYSFDVSGTLYSGDNYNYLTEKPIAKALDSAVQTVRQINSTDALEVAYNPANPSQNLVSPASVYGTSVMIFIVLFHCLFYIVYIRLIWMGLAMLRFADPESVYRVPIDKFCRFDLAVSIMFGTLICYCLMAPWVPVSNELFGALMLCIGIASSYSLVPRAIKRTEKKATKQLEAGKTLVYGLKPA